LPFVGEGEEDGVVEGELGVVFELESVDANRVCCRRSRWRHDEHIDDSAGLVAILPLTWTAVIASRQWQKFCSIWRFWSA
jgi:hypothetical protein